ncbi:WD repeat-containing protein 54 [Camelus dromedarius]|uniref:WD repeat-containing protein 54 n=1 Tax=Camelus dromedarius TaxID=9838 RepID=A0A5N4D6V5_CAMDR|nr:WD repeat-containing protein 54 [Camelus dromedarius]
MFRRERSIPLRGSAAALCNNFSVLQQPVRNLTHIGVVHGPGAQLLSAAPEGVPLAQRQLHAKEGAGVSSPFITQVNHGVGSGAAETSPQPSPSSPNPEEEALSTGVSSLTEYCWYSLHIEEYR